MAEQSAAGDQAPKKASGKGLLIGLAIMAVAAGGAFYAVRSGLVAGGPSKHEEQAPDESPLPDIAFVPVEPVVVPLGPEGVRHLRFSAQLEVPANYRHEVELILPRVADVLNTYLRAIDMAEFDRPESLVRLRAQMLRRIRMVAGDGRVRDLLITEYVVN